MKRLAKISEEDEIDSLCNWIENRVPISENQYNKLLDSYKVSCNCYRVLGFDISDIENSICAYFDIDMYDDNSGKFASKQEFLNSFKTIIEDNNKICSWTNNEDSINELINDASNSYDVIILISANIEGIDINKIINDNKEKMNYLLYDYQNEILGRQISESKVLSIYMGGSYGKIDIPNNGNLNEYINLFV